jgi:translation initiation factor 2A
MFFILEGEGPIHCASWSPKSNQFVVVFGYMPASATLFNMKCDVVFDFGTGIRNSVYWNQFGNLLLFGGFGNLRGNIEVWDMNKKKQVSATTAADTTQLEWSPSGDLYFTATTAPRLRQANGFKIWHYSGALLYENLFAEKQELYELVWQQYPDGFWKEPEITEKKVEGIQSVQPQASTKKYVPPNIRNFGEDSASSNVTPPAQGPIPGLPPGYTSSAAAAKNNKKGRNQIRAENFRNNKQQQQNSADNKKDSANNPKTTENGNNKKNRNNNQINNTNDKVAAKESPAVGGDKEATIRAKNPVQRTPREPRQQRDSFSRISKDSPASANNDNHNAVAPSNKPQMSEEDKKKVSAIKKKLKDIKALKEKQEKGDKLDKNQLKKISIESELNNELAALKLSA